MLITLAHHLTARTQQEAALPGAGPVPVAPVPISGSAPTAASVRAGDGARGCEPSADAAPAVRDRQASLPVPDEARDDEDSASQTDFSSLPVEALSLITCYARDEKNGLRTAGPLQDQLNRIQGRDGDLTARRVIQQMVTDDPACLVDAKHASHARHLTEGMARKAVEKDGTLLRHLPAALQTPEVCRAAMRQTLQALRLDGMTWPLVDAYIGELTETPSHESAAAFEAARAARTLRIDTAVDQLLKDASSHERRGLDTLAARVCAVDTLPLAQPHRDRALALRLPLLRATLQAVDEDGVTRHIFGQQNLEFEWAEAAVQQGPATQRQARLEVLTLGWQAFYEVHRLSPDDLEGRLQWHLDNLGSFVLPSDGKASAGHLHSRQLQLQLLEAEHLGYCRALAPEHRTARAISLCAQAAPEDARFAEADAHLRPLSLRALYTAMSPAERGAEATRLQALSAHGAALDADAAKVLAIARTELARLHAPVAGVGDAFAPAPDA